MLCSLSGTFFLGRAASRARNLNVFYGARAGAPGPGRPAAARWPGRRARVCVSAPPLAPPPLSVPIVKTPGAGFHRRPRPANGLLTQALTATTDRLMSAGSIRGVSDPQGVKHGKSMTRRVPSAREGEEVAPSEVRSAQPAGARLPPQLDAAQPQADAQPDGNHRREAASEQRGLPEVRRHLSAQNRVEVAPQGCVRSGLGPEVAWRRALRRTGGPRAVGNAPTSTTSTGTARRGKAAGYLLEGSSLGPRER